ncbi:LuxR C-terminal-related transcriptional regulator [Actinoplanes sp. NPDC023936]|uniref:LuxR C-terminal-related transcriptional regulator n=1 Tax=Actinoplanes sp. NPDC023936 TaxID=3154910 RepID=UPI00340F6B99
MTDTRRPIEVGPLPTPVMAKTASPQRLRAAVARRRLFALLDAGAGKPVTLVCAGAGWGKTTLVSAWARTRPAPVAWLSLDRHDNDPQRYWSYVLAALRSAGALPPDHPLAALESVPADERERAALLTAGLSRLPDPTVLAVDDFHEIDDPQVLREMSDLLRHPPAPLRLVLISRVQPGLAAVRHLRAAGLLAEIRASDLRFTGEEAAALAHDHGLDLASSDVDQLVARTEGWAAGLHLGAGFLAGHGERAIADFAGDIRGIDDYLANEVLANRPAEERRFLLQTSVCERICAGLANAISGRDDSQRRLEQLEHDDDFVVRLGAKPLWFRYHHLLRDALAHRLTLEDPTAVAELHARAARWYAANDSVMEALNHAIAGGDWAYVGQIVATQGPGLILSAQQTALVKMLRRIPPEQTSATPELIFCSVVLLFHAGDYEAIPARIARARAMLRRQPDTASRRATEMTLFTAEMMAERAVGNMPAVIAVSTGLLGMLAAASDDGLATTQLRAVGLNHRGLAQLWAGRPGAAIRDLGAAASAARAAGVELAEINATGHLALLHALCGSVDEAGQLAAAARAVAEHRGWRYSLQAVPAHFAQALVELERHDLDAAQETLRQGIRAHHGNPEAAQRVVARGLEARLAAARGEHARARLFLDEARRDRSPALHAPTLDRWLALIEAETSLATGSAKEPDWPAETPDQDTPLALAQRVARARFAYAAHDLRGAEELLGHAPISTLSQTVATVTAGVLGALVADARGHGVRAVDLLREAVVLAAREGIRHPFVALAGSRLDDLAQRLRLLGGDTLFLDQMGRSGARPATGQSTSHGLSERESEVLHYLPTMLTAAEIAAILGVSVNTVKAHMRAIYRKLDAARRSEAVTVARRHGIL